MSETPGSGPTSLAPRSSTRSWGLTALALVLTLQACASSGTTGDAARRDPNLLTAEDMAAVNNLSVYDAVQRLRPNWLRSRGATSVMGGGDTFPAVMVDNAFHSLDYLRSLQVTGVELVRYIEARDATTRYGTGYVNGIVEVVMAGRGRAPGA